MNPSNRKPPAVLPVSKPPAILPALTELHQEQDDDRMPLAAIAAISAAVAIILLLLILMMLMWGRSGANSGLAGTGTANETAGESMTSNPNAQEQGAAKSDGLVELPAEEKDGSLADAESGTGKSEVAEGKTEEPNQGDDAGTIDWAKEEGDLFATTGTQGIGSFTQSGVKMFGIEGEGKNIVYIIDRSSSMAGAVYNLDGSAASAVSTRFEMACRELMRSIDGLNPDQIFTIVFFNDGALHDARFVACSPTTENRKRLRDWIGQIGPYGNTNPIPAVQVAFDTSFVPVVDLVFLLSDGEFHDFAVDQIKSLNSGRAVIHTISLLDNARTLEQIANQNGGRYVTAK